MSLKKQYENVKTFAVCDKFGGIELKDILYGIEDYVIFAAGTMGSVASYHKAKVYYGGSGGFFKYRGRRIRLDECLKVNW